jgi:hypothetical protein
MPERDENTAVDAWPSVRVSRTGGARRARWPVVLVLVWVALAVVDLAFIHAGIGSGRATAKSAAAPSLAARGHPVAAARPGARASGHRAARSRVLTPVRASAIGADGLGSGDNPQIAYRAIDASTATAWVTNWYRTPRFGGLHAGTGLLVDMGRPVRITSVRILLGSSRGADLRLFTGSAPTLTGMRRQARANDAGGRVRLKLTRPQRARYLLVWFTSLPPDSSGTFQVSVYKITIVGTAARRPRKADGR